MGFFRSVLSKSEALQIAKIALGKFGSKNAKIQGSKYRVRIPVRFYWFFQGSCLHHFKWVSISVYKRIFTRFEGNSKSHCGLIIHLTLLILSHGLGLCPLGVPAIVPRKNLYPSRELGIAAESQLYTTLAGASGTCLHSVTFALLTWLRLGSQHRELTEQLWNRR